MNLFQEIITGLLYLVIYVALRKFTLWSRRNDWCLLFGNFYKVNQYSSHAISNYISALIQSNGQYPRLLQKDKSYFNSTTSFFLKLCKSNRGKNRIEPIRLFGQWLKESSLKLWILNLNPDLLLRLIFKRSFLLTIIMLFPIYLQAATITSTGIGGDWSSGLTWVGGTAPGSADDVVIASGTTVTINGAITTNSLTIRSGGSLVVSGTNTLTVTGNWVNDGMFTANNSTVVFSGNSDTSFGGISPSAFYDLTISKTNGLDDVIEFTSAGTVSCSHTLNMTNGLLKFTSGTINLNCNSAFTINKPSGIWVAGATLNTGGFTITNEGLVRISSGTATFGTQSGNSVHTQIDGAFEVIGGNAFIAGRLENTAGGYLVNPVIPSGLNISGGNVTVGTVGNGASSAGTLDVSTNGAFNFAGGTIIFQYSSTATTPLDVALVLGSGSGAKSTSGGTFQLGNGNTPAGTLFRIDSEIPIDNLTLTTNASVVVVGSDLTISNLLKMQGGNIDAATNGKKVILSKSNVNALDNSSGYITGTVQRAIGTGAAYRFPVGNATNGSTPLLLSFAGQNSTGNIAVSSVAGVHSNLGSSLLSTTNVVNNYWNYLNTGVTFSGIDAEFNTPSNITSNYKIGIYNSGWSYPDVLHTLPRTIRFAGLGTLGSSVSFAIAECTPPTITLGTNPAVCSGATLANLGYSATTGTPTEYRVDYNATANAAGLSDVVTTALPASPIPLSIPAGISTGTYNATLYVSNAADCESNGVDFTITVNALPAINNITLAAICSGGTFTSTPTNGTDGIVPTGTTYSWAAPTVTGITGVVAGTNAASVSSTLTNTTNSLINVVYIVTPTSGSCPGLTFTVTVPVNPKPAINNITLAAICSGGTFTSTPTNGTDGIVPTGTTYTWAAPTIAGITGTAAGVSSASIGGTLTNTTNAPINVVYSVTPTSGSCPGPAFTVTVPVNPKPAINNNTLATICSGGTFTFTPANGTDGIVPTGTTYTWAAPTVAGITGTAAGVSSASIGGTLTNTTNAPINVVYSVTPTSGSCPGPAFTVTVLVNPKPMINNITLAAICSGGTFASTPVNGTDGLIPAGTTYSWVAPTVAGITGTVAGTNAANISGTLTNTTNLPINVVYTVTPLLGSCSGASFTVTVKVYPHPTVTAPPDKSYCIGETTLAIPLNGVPSDAVFDISGGTAIGLTNKTGVTQIPSYAATTGSATITITPRANGCTGTPVTFNVTVNPRPNIHLSASARTICSGESTNITISSTTPGATFSWVVYSMTGTITGASSGTGNLLDQTLLNNTATTGTVVYQITASTGTCEGATINLTVTVHPAISAIVAGTATACQNDSPAPAITFTATGGAAPYTFTYNINGGANQQVVASSGNTATVTAPTNAAGTFTYNLVSVAGSAGCAYPQTGTATVTVNPKPVLTSTLTPAGICSNTAFSYIPTSGVLNTTFAWRRDAIPGISNLSNTGTDNPDELLENTTNAPIPVTYVYTLQSPDGCINTQNVTVMVTPTPHLTSATTGLSVCSGTPFSYIPTSDVTGMLAADFPWTRAAVAGITNPAATGTGNPNEVLINTTTGPVGVTYIYTLKSNDCQNPVTYSVPVVVVPAPIVTAGATPSSICSGSTVSLTSSSNITSTKLPILLNEPFNSAAVGATSGPNGWITTNTNTTARWTVRQDGYNYTGTIFNSNDNSRFYLANSRAAGNTNIDSRLTSPSINTTGYNSLLLSFWHYYRSGGSSDHAEIMVSTDNLNWTSVHEFTSDQGNNSSSFVNYILDISGYVGSTSLYVQFRYQGRNDYYWAIDNVTVSGTPTVTANILWTSSTSSWTSTQKDVSVSPTETTTYTVTYTDPNTHCSGSASTLVSVYPTPDATITANYCEASPKIRLRTGSFATYSWSPLPLGETNGKQYIDIDIAGIYTVNVTDANGCTGTASINVSNEYVINGDFSAGNTGFVTPATSGNQYTYVANGGGNTELWPEGLYGIGTNANDYHSNFWGIDHTTGTGKFMIVNGFPGAPQPIVWQQTIINLLPNTDYYFSAWAISLNSAGNDAQLRFSINGTQLGTIADLTTIPGVSNSSNSWHNEGRFYGVWNSGSNTSAILSIVDLQTAPSGNDFGIDDISFGILDPSPATISPTSSNDVCSGGAINLYANVTGGKEPIVYTWTYPNGMISHDKDPVISDADATYDGTYTLKVTDWYGCDIPAKTTHVTVHPKATVNAGPDQLHGCSAASIFDLNGSRGGAAISSTWTTSGSGTFDDATSLTAKYTISAADIAAGSVTLTLTTDDPTGPCLAVSDDMVITINRSPELTVIVAAPLCAGYNDGSATATVTNGTAPFTYSWSNGQTTAKATGLVDGSYTVTVTDAKGCTDTETISVIEPTPLVVSPASFTPPTCYGGNNGTATVNAEGGTEPYVYQWDAAAGSQTTKTAVGLKVGIYLFTVTDANGCNITSDFVLVTQPEPPSLLCPSDPDPVSVIGGATTAPVILTAPIYDPVCQILSWTMSGATVVSTPVLGVVPSPYTFNVGTTTVEYSAVNVAGEELTCTFDVVVIGGADLSITKTANPSPVNTGDMLVYTITVSNNGPADAVNVSIADVVAALPSPEFTTDLVNGPWNPWVTPYLPGNLASGGSITIYIRGTVPLAQCGNIDNTAKVSSDTNDDDLSNNSATITTPVADNQPPTFTLPATELSYCVNNIISAVYNPTPTPLIIPEYDDITTPRPEYYQLTAASKLLDLDPIINNFEDNCCADNSLIIHWRIVFAPTPNPATVAHEPITKPAITGQVGQPSAYGDIQFPGDGVTFTDIVHRIYYWLEDCNGNPTGSPNEQFVNITISPRPNIMKVP